jgi:nucleoside-diphosphate-sugar epimerase
MPPYSLPEDDLNHVLLHAGDVWEDLRGGRVFLTGGTGFFGIWLVESFLWANEALRLGAEMLVLSRDPRAFLARLPHLGRRADLGFLTGEAGNFTFPDGPLSHVIHAAAERFAPPNDADGSAKFERDVQGARRVLELARRCSVKSCLLTSSGAVYGRQPPAMTGICEDYAVAPDTMNVDAAYGHAKRVAELLAAMAHEECGLPSKIARCFAFVGQHLPLDYKYAIGNFIRDGLRGGPIVVRGDGTPFRSYLYAADLAAWLWAILLRGKACRPYNVGSEDAITVADLARTVAECFSPMPEVRIMRAATPDQAADRYVPSTRRARLELGLHATIGLREAILRTIRGCAPQQ